MTYKLLHIHSNPVFIEGTLRYQNKAFINKIIYFGEKSNKIESKLKTLPFEYEIVNTTKRIIEEASNYDGLVINELNQTNITLLQALPDNIKIFLRLFGGELYSKNIPKYVSKKTFYSIYNISNNKFSPLRYLKLLKRKVFKVGYKYNKDELTKVYKRIDAILLFNKFEYDALKEDFYLPKYIQLALNRQVNFEFHKKDNTIILGNSRHFWNNHLDVFDELSKANIPDGISFKLFFSYGNVLFYEDEVKEKANELSNTEVIERFLPADEFETIYNSASALVINSYRQHALGNIFTALLGGCKIYLNKKSSTYQWLKSENFYVSELNELAKDIESGNYKLKYEEMLHNVQTYEKLQREYTISEFSEALIDVLKNN
ncbi:MAG: hypothetical protein WC994_02755 [Brumimicrobium sp.]